MQLSLDQLSFWEANSYLVLRGFFGGGVEALSEWVSEVEGWERDSGSWLHFFEREDPTVLSRIENFVPEHAGLAGLLTGPLLMGLLEALAGEPMVLYKDRINFKNPGGGAHSAHQDGVAYEAGMGNAQFDVGKRPYLSALISVDPATCENACLEVVPEWDLNRREILQMERPLKSDPRFSKIADPIEARLEWIPLPIEPGDVVVFTERLPHRSGVNRSRDRRRIVYGVYNPASEGDLREGYFEKKRAHPDDPRYMVGNPHASRIGN